MALSTTPAAVPWEGDETPPFVIDFDEISFELGTADRQGAVAQLVVEGVTVLQTRPPGRRSGGQRGMEGSMQTIIWPVYPWQGRSAVLRFVDAAAAPHWLDAGRVRSLRHSRRLLFDGFEADGYSQRWEEVFDGGPSPLRDLALVRGPGFLLSGSAASSLGREGGQTLRSLPFAVSSDFLSMLVLESGAATRITLRVAGRRVRSFRGRREVQSPRALTWNLTPFLGRTAVLSVVDGDPSAQRGVVVDEIVFFDRESPG